MDVIGTSKGRGFAGVVRRHGFGGGPKSHGHMFQVQGSIGASSFPSRVFPGQRMPGHMGDAQITVRNLRIRAIDLEDNLLLVEGAVPGHREAFVLISKAKAPPRERRGFRRCGHEGRVEGFEEGCSEQEEVSKKFSSQQHSSRADAGQARTEGRRHRSPAKREEEMANINVVSLKGEKVGEFELLDEVFAAGINEALLWEAVKHYRAALRQGTAATKVRKNVSGAGRKLWKQKGTGRARVGSIRTPLWRGGGTVHGPQPRSYEYQFPRKKLMGALRSAIAAKIADGKFTVVDTLTFWPKARPSSTAPR